MCVGTTTVRTRQSYLMCSVTFPLVAAEVWVGGVWQRSSISQHLRFQIRFVCVGQRFVIIHKTVNNICCFVKQELPHYISVIGTNSKARYVPFTFEKCWVRKSNFVPSPSEINPWMKCHMRWTECWKSVDGFGFAPDTTRSVYSISQTPSWWIWGSMLFESSTHLHQTPLLMLDCTYDLYKFLPTFFLDFSLSKSCQQSHFTPSVAPAVNSCHTTTPPAVTFPVRPVFHPHVT